MLLPSKALESYSKVVKQFISVLGTLNYHKYWKQFNCKYSYYL